MSESLWTFGPFSVTWFVSWDKKVTVYGETPRRAIANSRRIRRDFFICGKPSGWLSPREQWRWTRLARRVGLV